MNIKSFLKERNLEISETDKMYIGYYTTPQGVVVSEQEGKCEVKIFRLKFADGLVIPCSDRPIYFIKGTKYENSNLPREEVIKLAENGEIISIKGEDFYRDFYDFENNKELECCFTHRYSLRSRQYVEGIMKEIGLLRYTDCPNSYPSPDGELETFDSVCKYNLFVNGDTDTGKIEDNLWIAQTCFWIEIDDFAVIKMYFDHLPTEEQIRTAFQIRRFEQHPREVFKCWECGRKVNWLDAEGDIRRKLDMAEDKYCGC